MKAESLLGMAASGRTTLDKLRSKAIADEESLSVKILVAKRETRTRNICLAALYLRRRESQRRMRS
jgi:hypothetical protein